LTPGLRIDLGALSVPGASFGLIDPDLGQVTAGVLRIGSAGAGDINVTARITAHAGYDTLSLSSGGATPGTRPPPPAAPHPARPPWPSPTWPPRGRGAPP